MSTPIPADILDGLTTFGELLRYLRRRAGLTQAELSIGVGYSEAQISRLEQNLRLPNLATVQARFLPALKLKKEAAAIDKLQALARQRPQVRTSPGPGTTPATGVRMPSIAVLPFANISSDPENDYFCEGLAEELINALSRIKGCMVVARGSAFSFRGDEPDIREIGRRLNVDTVLRGAVQREGERVRVTVHLIDAANGFQFWSERFDRTIADLFALQDELIAGIVGQLRVQWLEREPAPAPAPAPASPASRESLGVYNTYLKGRFYWAQRPQGIDKAIEHFKQAVAADPGYARAHAGLADCYVTLGSWENGTLPPIEAMRQAKQSAERALLLDTQMVEAHTSLAYRTCHYEWDWQAADQQFQRAFELNPNYAVCYHWYSHYLTAVGRTDESLAASLRCLELDPLDLVINIHMAWHHYFARQYEQSIEQCWRTSELHPNSFWPAYFFGLAYAQQGQIGRAVEEFQTAVQMSKGVTFAAAALGHLYGVSGSADKAATVLKELTERARTAYVPAYDLCLVSSGLGRTEQALDFLEQAHAERSGWIAYLRVDPRLDPLRQEPRFVELLRRVRLTA